MEKDDGKALKKSYIVGFRREQARCFYKKMGFGITGEVRSQLAWKCHRSPIHQTSLTRWMI